MSEIINKNSASSLKTIAYQVHYNGGASKQAERDVYTGVIEVKETYKTSDIAERLVAEGCPINAQGIELVLMSFGELTAKLVAEGRAVSLPGMVRFAPAVRGTFDSLDEGWNEAKHAIVVNATIGNRMRSAAAKSSVQRIVGVILPKLEQLVDMTTQSSDVISSEGTFMVIGEQLTWDDTAEDEGFFINVAGEETKCLVIENDDPNCAVVKSTQLFESAGLPVELFFRARIGGKLHQVKYDDTIVTAVA